MAVTKEQMQKLFIQLEGTNTDWSHAADMFISWCVKRNFKPQSFDNFVEYFNELGKPVDSVWNFFFGYGHDYEKFAEEWVEEEEQEDYLDYCINPDRRSPFIE